MKICKKIIIGMRSFLLFLKYKILYGNSLKMKPINSIKERFRIELGKNATCKIGTFLMSDGPFYLKIGEKSSVSIGNCCFFNHNVSITANQSISIGNNCYFANNLVIVDHDHLMSAQENSGSAFSVGSVKIGDNVWVGANVTILKSVSIGDGAVIAAGAVVNKDIPAHELWGGIPAKKIKGLG